MNYRRRQLYLSSLNRALRWEFWPMWLFYIPVVFYVIYLSLRYRGLTFTAVNPGMPGSGFIGENKSLALLNLQQNVPDKVAKTLLVSKESKHREKVAACQQFIQSYQLDYPLVLKPDYGQRGVDVEIIRDQNQLEEYLADASFDTVVQEYIPGVEFGVFYIRDPSEAQGSIFSLTHKTFPFVVGDGEMNLEQLICEHPRLHYMAAFLLEKHRNKLHTVLPEGERFDVVTLGSHCRGSLFLEGGQYMSAELDRVIQETSHCIEGFYFGRYDVRAKDIEAFMRGDIKVIEVNGVTSESTNIYDPKNSVFFAYRVLFKQWRKAFLIGQKNIRQGYKPMTISDLIGKVKIMNHGH